MNVLNNPPFIPENAPFSKEQIGWLNGYLAGMYSAQGASAGVAEPVAATPLTILWGSQTGNTEMLAKQVAKSLKAKGFEPNVVDMGDYDKEQLKDEDLLLLMTSTYGEGDPPDNAADLYEWILSDSAPRLEKLRYSVLSLGDTNYADFCKCGIDFDERLKALGASQIAPRVDCDADFDDAFEVWLSSLDSALGAATAQSESDSIDELEAEPAYGKKNPFPAKVVDNRNLNGESSAKETRHVALSIEGSGLSYEPGDALAVVPSNDSEYVDDFIAAAGFAGDEEVNTSSGEKVSLGEALLLHYDPVSLSPKTLNAYAALCGDAELGTLLSDKEAFKKYSWGRQLIDVLSDFQHTFESADQLISIMNKVAPRLYSISSSPKAHQDEVHVTVGVVKYNSFGRERKGVCSNFLAAQDLSAPVSVYFHPTKSFKLPEDNDVPIIMVGPGTGIAPFRSFLEERASREAKGDNWLFFGDQHAACDFLYSDEIGTYQKSGLLTRFETAFSRDQKEKVYVQDRMIEHGEELYAWLERGAHFYVCGDASRMAKDVDAALHTLAEVHGGMSAENAVAYVKKLKSEKRYLRDVY